MPFALLENRGVLTVSGSDRSEFLQGLVSNDVTRLNQGQPVWAALLTPQGKYKHDFFLIERNGTILLDCEGGDRLIDLGRSLRRFVLRSDVTLGIEQSLSSFVVWGDDCAKVAGSALVEPFADGVVFPDPRLEEMGARILASVEQASKALADLGIAKADVEDWHSHRISCGVPDGSRDMEIEKTILLEVGFDELNGVDWNKGCYMGQELTARTKYRGLIKRRLIPVAISGGEVRADDDVKAGERVVGRVKSVAADGEKALATIRLDAVPEQAGPITAGQAVLTPLIPSWMPLAGQD